MSFQRFSVSEFQRFKVSPPLPKLLPGDTLLYAPTEIIGVIIAFKTWTWLSHVEVYIGDGMSLGARIQGVNLYPSRIDKSLRFVRRPWLVRGRGFDANAAYNAAAPLFGRPYDIGSFEAFFNPWSRNRHSNRVCSTLTAAYLKGGGCMLFNPALDQDDISPAQLWQTPALRTIWQSHNSPDNNSPDNSGPSFRNNSPDKVPQFHSPDYSA